MTDAGHFPRSAPEAQGIRSNAIQAFVNAVENDVHDLHSFILLRHGVIVAEGYWEPYGATYPHVLFSLSKSFTSTAIGFLVAEGRLSVDDRVLDYFPDDAPAEPSPNLRAMTIRDLLTMTTGHDTDATGAVRQPGATWTRAFLSQPVEHPPGTHFVYNSAATYILSAIAQKVTGQRLIHYLQARLFSPLGIEDPTWETSPEGIDVGGWGLSVTTMDVARFGQLYLAKGVWQGARLLPERWVAEATSRQVPNGPSANPDWVQGYGYQFWRCRYGAYRGDGAFGQFCVVLPDQDAVLAITAGTRNMQTVLDLVWEHLLPAFGPAALADHPAAQKALANRLAALRLAPPAGQPASPLAAEVSGREFTFESNIDRIHAMRFDFVPDDSVLTLRNDQGEQTISCGYNQWSRGGATLLQASRADAEAGAPAPVAASGAWPDDRTYVVDLCWYKTPFRRTLNCRFEGDRLVVDQQVNVSFGPTERPCLQGRAAPVLAKDRR